MAAIAQAALNPRAPSPSVPFRAHGDDARVGVYKSETMSRDFWFGDLLAAEVHDDEITRLADFSACTDEEKAALAGITGECWLERGEWQTSLFKAAALSAATQARIASLCIATAKVYHAASGYADAEFSIVESSANRDWHYDILPAPSLNLVKPLRIEPKQALRGTRWAVKGLTRDTLSALRGGHGVSPLGMTFANADADALFMLKNAVENGQPFEEPRDDALFHCADGQRALTFLFS